VDVADLADLEIDGKLIGKLIGSLTLAFRLEVGSMVEESMSARRPPSPLLAIPLSLWAEAAWTRGGIGRPFCIAAILYESTPGCYLRTNV